jgi:DNA-binding winged helix-turn-helix (wHTH) protein/tetratricopeptide (TPR) repeat protein
MSTSPRTCTARYQFGDCELDDNARELRRAGQIVDIEPQSFELLRLLASDPEHTFSKDEIAAALWPNRVISDSVIAQAVRKARQACGDSASTQSVIKTIHGVGYRFSASLGSASASASPASRVPGSNWSRSALWFVTGAVLIAAVILLPQRPQPPLADPIIIAALPATETGLLTEPIVAGLESLLSRGVAENSQIRLITTGQTLRTLGALGIEPDSDNEVLLEALQEALGARFLLRTLIDEVDDSYRVRAELVASDGRISEIAPPQGDIVTMVRGFSHALVQELGSNWRESDGVPILSGENFVNQVYARALSALLAGENQTAALLFESVLNLDPELTYAEYELGNARWQLGDHEQARSHYLAALETATVKNSARLAGHSANMLGVLAWQAGDLQQARAWYEQSLTQYELIDDHHGAASSLGNLGNLADTRGDLDQAAELHLLARERFQAAHDLVGKSATHTNLAVISRLRGRMHEAHRRQQTAADLQRQLGIGSMLVRSLTYLAALECELGHCSQALALLDEAEGLAQTHGNRLGLAEINLERARLALIELRPISAAQLAEAVRADFTELDMPAGQALALTVLAESALMLGDPERAQTWLELADRIDQGASRPRDRAERALLQVRVKLGQGKADSAGVLVEPLLDDTDTVIAARAQELVGEIYWTANQHDKAIQSWQQALDNLDGLDDPRGRAAIRLRLSHALLDLGQIDLASRHLTLAREWSPRATPVLIAGARLHIERNEHPMALAILPDLAGDEAPSHPVFPMLLTALEANPAISD